MKHESILSHFFSKSVMAACVFGALSAGCARSVSDSEEGGVVAVSTTEFAPAEEFVSDYEYVVLETSDSCILSGQTMFHTSDRYIVAYSEKGGIDVFNREGKHLNHFSNYGMGPGEAIKVIDFYISGDEMVCVPLIQHNLLVYNVLSGEFLREIPLPDSYFYASPFSNGLIALSPLYSNNSHWNINIYDPKTKSVVNQYLPYQQESSLIIGGFNVFAGTGEGCVYGVLPFDYTLYRITADTCRAMVRYEFNTPEQIEAFDPETVDIADLSDRYRYSRLVKWLGKYCETESGAHYQQFDLLCEYGVLPFLCKFDGESSKSETLRIGAEILDRFPFLMVKPFEMKDGYYISAMEAMAVLNIEESIKSDTFAKLGLTEDSNPVIFFHKLK